MFDTFPRLFGKERRIVYSKHQLDDLIKLYNGKKTCLISLYAFAETTSEGVVPDSAIIDTICWVCKGEEEMLALKKGYPDLELKVMRFPDSRLVFLHPIPIHAEQSLSKVIEAYLEILDSAGVDVPETFKGTFEPITDLFAMVPYPGTKDMRTGELIILEGA